MASGILSYAPFFDEKLDFISMTEFERAKHNLMRILLTPKGSNDFDLNYGASPRGFVFDFNNPNILGRIRTNVERQIEQYEHEFASYVDVRVIFYKPELYQNRFILLEVTLFNDTTQPIRIVVDSQRKQDFVVGQ